MSLEIKIDSREDTVTVSQDNEYSHFPVKVEIHNNEHHAEAYVRLRVSEARILRDALQMIISKYD